MYPSYFGLHLRGACLSALRSAVWSWLRHTIAEINSNKPSGPRLRKAQEMERLNLDWLWSLTVDLGADLNDLQVPSHLLPHDMTFCCMPVGKRDTLGVASSMLWAINNECDDR